MQTQAGASAPRTSPLANLMAVMAKELGTQYRYETAVWESGTHRDLPKEVATDQLLALPADVQGFVKSLKTIGWDLRKIVKNGSFQLVVSNSKERFPQAITINSRY